MSRMIDRLVTDLPLPDSPTSASVEPRGMAKLTSSTALTTPARVWKCVLRFLISRMLSCNAHAFRFPALDFGPSDIKFCLPQSLHLERRHAHRRLTNAVHN